MLRGVWLRHCAIEEWQFAAPWNIQVAGDFAVFYALLDGDCWLTIDGAGTAVRLVPGDLIVVAGNRVHSLRDRLNSSAVPVSASLGTMRKQQGRTSALDAEGRSTRLICGYSPIDRRAPCAWLASLPSIIHLRGIDGRAAPWLDDILRLMAREAELNLPGRLTVVDHLAQLVFMQAIRVHVSTLPEGGGNWLAALADPDIGPALRVIHAQPELPWTVASLAERVCLSRSSFAARFKALVSKPPVQYLLDCRLRKACVLLIEGGQPIKVIAARVGYATEAAFSHAFKRWCGKSPRAFRHEGVTSRHPEETPCRE